VCVMKVKEFWDKFKELIMVLAGIATIATFVIVYFLSDSKSNTPREPSSKYPGSHVPDTQRRSIDDAQKEFEKEIK